MGGRIYFGSYLKGLEYIMAGKARQPRLCLQLLLEELFISQWIMKQRELSVQSGARR